MMAGTKLSFERRKEVDKEQMARSTAAAPTPPLGSDSPTITRYYFSSVLCTGWVGWGRCITSVLLWEEEWPVFVLPVCRPLAQ